MKVLAIEREAAGAEAENSPSLLNEEAKEVWDLHVSGIIREIYFRADRREAVLMLECPGVKEAKAILSALPLVKSGTIGFEIIPLAAYTGFSRLFSRYP